MIAPCLFLDDIGIDFALESDQANGIWGVDRIDRVDSKFA
ncbi:hypothetical protein Salpa_1020 [Sporomusa sp. KB1]|jgi:hypothetical protein|nr:hypothetical protein Salpa_1020 [Sporomusa sp. KB1]